MGITPQSTPSSRISAGTNSSLVQSQKSEKRSPNLDSDNGAVVEEVRLLRKEIELLTARIASLEAGHGIMEKDVSQRKGSSWSPVHLGLRSTILGKKNN